MSNFLVLSHKHGLFPLAWALKGLGHNVQVLVKKDRYERAWDGLFTKDLVGRDKGPANMQALVELAKDGELFVATDSESWDEKFQGVPRLYGTGKQGEIALLQLGAWWDGESFTVPHVIVRDLGAWVGNQGPRVYSSAGCSWLQSDALPKGIVAIMDGLKDDLKSSGHKGLVRVGINVEQDGTVSQMDFSTGWDVLHLHLLLSGVEDVGDVFVGQGRVTHRYSFALPVSIPPWPHTVNKSAKEIEIKGLTAEQRRAVGWHDVRKENGSLYTAGLDGLVGVVRRNSNHPQRCIVETLGVAESLELPEKQYRSDAGGLFSRVLMELEI